MQLIKSLSDGIGTAAGVAWPTFGILFGTLGLAIGGTTAIILGGFCIAIFAFVIGSVTYLAYQQYHKDQMLNKLNALNQQNIFTQLLSSYFFAITRKYLLENNLKKIEDDNLDSLVTYIINQINEDLATNKLSSLLKNNFEDSRSRGSDEDFILHQFIKTYKNKITLKNAPSIDADNFFLPQQNKFAKNVIYSSSYSAQIKSSMIGFFAAFGSIAGCAAGTYGLLAGIGVFAGLTAVPIAGWAALAAAILFGAIIAGICAYWTFTANKRRDLITQFEKANHDLELINHTRNTTIDIELKIQKKYQTIIHDDAVKNLHKRELRNTLKRSNSFELGRSYKNHSMWNTASVDLQSTPNLIRKKIT